MALPPLMQITYRFLFSDGRVHNYVIVMESNTGQQIRVTSSIGELPTAKPDLNNLPPVPALSEWAANWSALDNHKCSHCPLSQTAVPECPIAKNIVSVAEDFKSEKSIGKVTVEVIAPERTYRKELSIQEGLFGLMGLIMATSDCPYFGFLKPMARFHLPFSTAKETTVRSVSFYLLRQYFVAKKGGEPDFNLENFLSLYKDLEKVNLGLIQRIRSITSADAETNSIVILDGFAKILSHSITHGLPDLENMFA